MRLTNAIALAVRNIAVIRISVFILDFSFPGFSVRVERICLHSFQKKNAAEIAKEVWTTEENPSCQRSSTTERGVKVAPTFSTTDWVRRGCRQKRTAKTSHDSPSHYQRRDRKATSLAGPGLANNGARQCEQTRRGSKPPDFRIGTGSGSYSGPNNPASITMGGPTTEAAVFIPIRSNP